MSVSLVDGFWWLCALQVVGKFGTAVEIVEPELPHGEVDHYHTAHFSQDDDYGPEEQCQVHRVAGVRVNKYRVGHHFYETEDVVKQIQCNHADREG